MEKYINLQAISVSGHSPARRLDRRMGSQEDNGKTSAASRSIQNTPSVEDGGGAAFLGLTPAGAGPLLGCPLPSVPATGGERVRSRTRPQWAVFGRRDWCRTSYCGFRRNLRTATSQPCLQIVEPAGRGRWRRRILIARFLQKLPALRLLPRVVM